MLTHKNGFDPLQNKKNGYSLTAAMESGVFLTPYKPLTEHLTNKFYPKQNVKNRGVTPYKIKITLLTKKNKAIIIISDVLVFAHIDIKIKEPSPKLF